MAAERTVADPLIRAIRVELELSIDDEMRRRIRDRGLAVLREHPGIAMYQAESKAVWEVAAEYIVAKRGSLQIEDAEAL